MTNKLLERGSRMITEELNIPFEESKKLLIEYGSVKKAIDTYRHKK